jgi:hypothetical protein
MHESASIDRDTDDALSQPVLALGAAAAGATGMQYLDPDLGERRRALLAELVRNGLPSERRNGGRIARRSYAAALSGPQGDDPSSDAELRERVQSRLGRVVSHPGAIRIDVDQGVVRLSGRVLAKERDGLLAQVEQVPGVRGLVNAMSAHDHPREIVARDLPVSLVRTSR